MVSPRPFGNDPSKIEKYRAFWNREDVERPLAGFTFRGFFPIEEYKATSGWQRDEVLTPDMVTPEEFMEDEERLLREGEVVDDDIIRGDSPLAAVVPWLSGMMGSELRIMPGNVADRELNLSWEELESIHLDHNNPWFKKYIEFAKALVERSQGRFPISQGAFGGPSDLLALLQGSAQSILGLCEYPGKASNILSKLADIFVEITEEVWKHIPLFQGGYFDGMYQLWAPGPIARLQEDASGLYSPELYRKFLQPLDRRISSHFSNSFIHLHSTSMFLLDAFLEIEEIKCFEINNDESGPPIRKMIPYFQMVQRADRSLLIRGYLTPHDIRLLTDSLDPRGLYLLCLVKNMDEVGTLRLLLGM